jgi:hypothetical protein
MKRLILSLVLAASLSGCVSETEHGQCLGVQQDAERNPKKIYKLSIRNTVLAVIFSETLFVPLIVIFDRAYCPVASR